MRLYGYSNDFRHSRVFETCQLFVQRFEVPQALRGEDAFKKPANFITGNATRDIAQPFLLIVSIFITFKLTCVLFKLHNISDDNNFNFCVDQRVKRFCIIA
jgi:hypothetical protein